MALSKASKREDQGSIEIMGAPEAQRRVQATIAPEVMGLIIDRLTDAYTRPVDATVREVISNAIDTTERAAAAGRKALPVEVTSPTLARGMFVVKDHGEGMTADDVERVFSQYGNSTKRDDMTQTGAYGLGAKAPLAYCTEFRGVTVKDGVATTFSMKREATGTFSEIHAEEETALPNGTTIYVPVASGDIGKFAEAISIYQNYSIISPVSVDGNIAPITNYVLLADDLLLDAESNTRGRAWVNQTKIKSLILKRLGNHYGELTKAYLLSGWLYEPDSNRWRDAQPDIMVELKPGLVDFTTSRDEITENSRYEALASTVKAFVNNQSEHGLAEAFDVLKTLPSDERTQVHRALIGSVHAVGSDRFAYDLSAVHRTDGLKGYSVSLFDDGEKNLLGAIMGRYAKNVNMGFVADHTRNVPLLSKNQSVERTRALTAASTAAKQVEAIEVVKASVFQAASGSVASFILEQPIIMPAVSKIVLLTDCSADDAAKLLRGRKELASMGYVNALFLPVRNIKTIDKQVTLASEYTSTPVITVTAAKVLGELRARRASDRKARAPEETLSLYGRVIDGTDLATDAEVIAAHWQYGQTLNMDEILTGKWLVLLTTGGDNATLIGAANAGIKLAGKKIIQVGPNDLRAPHFKALTAKRTRLITNDNFPRRSAAATVALENRNFHGQVLDAELEALDLATYVSSVAKYSRVRTPVYRFLLNVAKAEKPGDKELHKLFRAAMGHESKGGGRMALSTAHLEQAFGVDTAARLHTFQAFLGGRLSSVIKLDSEESSAIQGLSFSYSDDITDGLITRAIALRIIETI